MTDAGRTLAVLTYHSIATASGPTSIAPATFRMQMEALAARGIVTLDVAGFLRWHNGEAPRNRCVLITFDDAFADFAEVAHPVLRAHGFSALVFAPTGALGGCETWPGAPTPPRALLDWPTVRALAGEGVEFGGHGVAHADLTRLSPDARRREIDGCAQALSARLGMRPRAFAAPYGRVDPAVCADIARIWDVAFGTRFARATVGADRFDVPRIEMHYFRAARRWAAFLDGHQGYLNTRRVLRAVRMASAALVRP